MENIAVSILVIAIISAIVGWATLPFEVSKIAKELGEIKEELKKSNQ